MITTTGLSVQHHARLMPHVDDLAVTGDLIGSATGAQLRPRLDEASDFLNRMLLPHMEASEAAIYPELERLMQNRHSMTPMRTEHARIRTLIRDLDARRSTVGPGRPSTGTVVALRRTLFQLHALLKVHLAEEQLYAEIVEHGLTPEALADLATAMEHEGLAPA
jgi:iron-sulfur cluster repair protein YtfE (RIC family)